MTSIAALAPAVDPAVVRATLVDELGTALGRARV